MSDKSDESDPPEIIFSSLTLNSSIEASEMILLKFLEIHKEDNKEIKGGPISLPLSLVYLLSSVRINFLFSIDRLFRECIMAG